jgi:phosphomannomutase
LLRLNVEARTVEDVAAVVAQISSEITAASATGAGVKAAP